MDGRDEPAMTPKAVLDEHKLRSVSSRYRGRRTEVPYFCPILPSVPARSRLILARCM
jgi:hypothetical protein